MNTEQSRHRTTVRGKYLEDQEESPVLQLDSEQWFEWLEENKSFRYIPDNSDKVARLNLSSNKRPNNYWYASRRMFGKTRQFYIGSTSKVTFENLQKIAYILALKENEYSCHKTEKPISAISRIDTIKYN